MSSESFAMWIFLAGAAANLVLLILQIMLLMGFKKNEYIYAAKLVAATKKEVMDKDVIIFADRDIEIMIYSKKWRDSHSKEQQDD